MEKTVWDCIIKQVGAAWLFLTLMFPALCLDGIPSLQSSYEHMCFANRARSSYTMGTCHHSSLSLHPSLILSQTGFFPHFLISDLFSMLLWALAGISGVQNRLPFHNTGNQWSWRDGFNLSASSHVSTPTCATQLPARVRVLKHWHHGEHSDNIEIWSISHLSTRRMWSHYSGFKGGSWRW